MIQKWNTLNLKNIAVIASFLLVALFVLRGLVFKLGTIGLARDWVFPPFTSQYSLWGSKSLFSINPYAGGTVNYYSAAYPLDLTMGLFSLFGLTGDAISKLSALFVVSFSGITVFYLSRSVKVLHMPSFVAGLFYMLSPVVFNKFVEGHFTYLVSYAIAPLVLALFIRSVKPNSTVNIKTSILAGLVFVPALAQVQFLVMLWVLLLLYSLFASSLRTIKLRLEVLGIVSLIVVLMHSPWILISIFGVKPEFIGHLAPTELLQSLSPKMIDGLLLLGGSGRALWLSYSSDFMLIAAPIMAFLAIILRPRNKMTVFFTAVTVVSLFLVKGINQPLGGIYSWLLFSAPIAGFRDVYHLMFLPSLGYSILIGMTTEKLTELSRNFTRPHSLFRAVSKRRVFSHNAIIAGFIVPFLLALIVTASLLPSLSGDFKGTVQVYDLGENYRNAYDYLASLEGDSRIAWLPMTSVVFSNHSQLSGTARDPMIVFSPKPAIDADTSVWDKYFAFLHKTIETQKTKFIGRILGTANVQYVISRSDTLSHAFTLERNWNQTQILDSQENLTLLKTFGDIGVFSNDFFLPQIYGMENVALVAGDLSVFVKLGYSELMGDQLPLLLFSQQLSPHDPLLNLADTLIIQDDNYEDFVFSFIPSQFKFGAGSYAGKVVLRFGWTYAGYTWGDPYVDWHYSTQLNEVAITFTNDTLSIPYTTSESAFYDFWAKTYFGDKGSSLSFSVDGNPFSEVSTKAPYNRFKWVNLGSLGLNRGEHFLNVTSDIGENAIGQIVIAPAQNFSDAFEFARESAQNKRIVILSEVENSFTPNDFLIPSDSWGANASEGVGLVSLAASNFTASLSVPSAGNYKLFLRTTNPESINQPSNASENKIIDNFEQINDWNSAGEGQVFQSPNHVKEGNSSLGWSISIDKSQTIPGQGNDHILYKEFADENWSAYDTISFWTYPKTLEPAEPNAQIFFHMRASEDNWYGGNYFVPYNQWTYLQIDISKWEARNDVNYIRALVGNSWGEYQNGQNVTFYIDQIRLDKKADEGAFQWVDAGNIHLEFGRDNVSLNIGEVGVGLDLLTLQNLDGLNNSNTGFSLSHSEINPAKYQVHVNATKPFFLVFSENFDPNWKAAINGTTLYHFPANFFANGYYVNATGEYDIIVEFSLESLYKIGQLAVLSTFTICISVVLIPEKKTKNLARKLHLAR